MSVPPDTRDQVRAGVQRPGHLAAGELAVTRGLDQAVGQGLAALTDHPGRQVLGRGNGVAPVAVGALAVQREEHRQRDQSLRLTQVDRHAVLPG